MHQQDHGSGGVGRRCTRTASHLGVHAEQAVDPDRLWFQRKIPLAAVDPGEFIDPHCRLNAQLPGQAGCGAFRPREPTGCYHCPWAWAAHGGESLLDQQSSEV